jgi:hypothetical protein
MDVLKAENKIREWIRDKIVNKDEVSEENVDLACSILAVMAQDQTSYPDTESMRTDATESLGAVNITNENTVNEALNMLVNLRDECTRKVASSKLVLKTRGNEGAGRSGGI